MRLHRLYRRQGLPIPPERAWAFFSDPANLAAITPPWLGFRITSELPPAIYPGLIVTYRVRPFGRFAVRWVTEITQAHPPVFFVDAQRIGPYRFWHHQHRFTPIEGGVLMEDTVHYALPCGPIGELLHRPLVRPRLEAIFDYRCRVLAERFGELAETGV